MKITDSNLVGENLESRQTPRGIKKTMGNAAGMEFKFTNACPRMHTFDEYWDTTAMPPVHHPKTRVLVLDGHVDAQQSVTTLIFGGNYVKYFPKVDLTSKETVTNTWNTYYEKVSGLKFSNKDGKLDAEFIEDTPTTQQWGHPLFYPKIYSLQLKICLLL